MDEQKKRQAEKDQVDSAIVATMRSYKDEFMTFYKSYYEAKGVLLTKESKYDIGPFELFVIQKLAKLTIATDLNQTKIENRVKEILNEFIEKVNIYAMGATEDGAGTGEGSDTGS